MTPEQKAQEYIESEYAEPFSTPSRWAKNAFLAGYAARDKEDGWIKLEDQLPPIDETVLLFDDWIAHDKSRTQEVRVGNLEYFTETTTSNGKTIDCHWFGTEFAFNITHWRPLPEPPKTK